MIESKNIDGIHDESLSVQIQKYSDTTIVTDCKVLQQWLMTQGAVITNKKTLGRLGFTVWRCRIGRHGWHHGFTINQAISSALNNR